MRSLLLLLFLFATSCSTYRYVYDLSQTYEQAQGLPTVQLTADLPGVMFDDAWTRVIEHFASNQFPVETLEKDSGLIVAKRMLVTDQDALAIASFGKVRTVARQMQEEMAFNPLLTPNEIRAGGNVVGRELYGTPLSSTTNATYRVTFTFNVFVRRSQAGTSITVNSSVLPEGVIELRSGTTGWNSVPWDASLAQVLASPRMSQRQAVPTPVSTGKFEAAFIAAMKLGT